MYEDASGGTLSDSVKKTALQYIRPKEVRAHLHLNARRLMCAQPAKEGVLAYVSAQEADVKAEEPTEVDGVQGKHVPAKQKWTADDGGAVQLWVAQGETYGGQRRRQRAEPRS